MFKDTKSKNNKKNVYLYNHELNFQKVNSIMNQRLFSLFDYLKVSIYFSHYDDKNNSLNGRNLEKFFKNKIFKTNPLSIPTLKRMDTNTKTNSSEKKSKNRYLNVAVNIKNDKLILKKNKYSTPYDLHLKKNKFLNNMIAFSKHIHSESKKKKNIKDKYPKVESISLSKKKEKSFSLTPIATRVKKLVIKTDRFTSTYDDKLIRNVKVYNVKRLTPNSKTFISFDNKINIQQSKNNTNNIKKKKIHIKINNDNSKSLRLNLNLNQLKKNDIRNKTAKLFRANVYYNRIYLQKMSKKLEKYTYLNTTKD